MIERLNKSTIQRKSNKVTLNDEQLSNLRSCRSYRGYLIGFLGRARAKNLTDEQISKIVSTGTLDA